MQSRFLMIDHDIMYNTVRIHLYQNYSKEIAMIPKNIRREKIF